MIKPLAKIKSAVKVARLFLGIVECTFDRTVLGGWPFAKEVVHEVKRFKDSLVERALLLQPVLQHLKVDGLCFSDDYAIGRRLLIVNLVVKVDFN